jgi:hypothetical protein
VIAQSRPISTRNHQASERGYKQDDTRSEARGYPRVFLFL